MTGLALFQHIIVWLPLVVGGIFLIRAGLRGRRVNDHPICRRCRFDLVGLGTASVAETPDTALETGATQDRPATQTLSHPDRCPECGTSLTGTTSRARRAVIDGERKKRWRLFAFGLVLLVSGLTTGFWLTYKPLAKFPWTTWAPDWVLAEMVDSANAARSDMVAREMLQRLQRDELSPRAVTRAATKILPLHADVNAPWRPMLGTIIEAARARGVLDDELWRAYAANVVVITVDVPPVVGAGNKVYYNADIASRVGSPLTRPRSRLASLGARVCERRQTLGSISSSRELGRHNFSNLHYQPSAGSGGLFDIASPSPGEHAGSVEFDVSVFNAEDVDLAGEPTSVLSHRTVLVPFTLKVIASSEYKVSLSSPTEMRETMRGSFAAQSIALKPLGGRVESMSSSVHVRRPPMDYAFAIMLILPSGEQRLGSMCGRAGSELLSLALADRPLEDLSPGGSVTIVLRPDAAAARSKPDIKEIWGEEIILENVPIVLEGE